MAERAAPEAQVVEADCEEDFNTTPEQARLVLEAMESARGKLTLLRDLAPPTAGVWEPIVEDPARRSYAYMLRREAGALTNEETGRWFRLLHPDAIGVKRGAWTESSHLGKKLLRKTLWYVQPPCSCAYDYSDTHQEVASDPALCSVLREITARVAEVCGVADHPPTSVNVNWYPFGGGIGWHSDDEPIFDGLRQDTMIISLSLAERNGEDGLGNRWFEVRLKRMNNGGRPANDEVKAVEVRHGDLMTMEGLFQVYYLHSVWPGDRTDLLEGPGRSALGERINLTWRWVVKHTAECEASKGGA